MQVEEYSLFSHAFLCSTSHMKLNILFQPGGGTPTQKDISPKPGLVASYGGDSDEEEEDSGSEPGKVDESKLLDMSKMACLLCKRQFQNKESLQRHTQMSDLHKVRLSGHFEKIGGEQLCLFLFTYRQCSR